MIKKLNLKALSRNKGITSDFIENYIGMDWNWGYNGLSKVCDIDFIEKHIDKDWFWNCGGISSNQKTTPEFHFKYRDKEWDIDELCKNEKFYKVYTERYDYSKYIFQDLKEILKKNETDKFFSHRFNWYNESCNFFLDSELVELLITKRKIYKWHWGVAGLSCNKSIDEKFIRKYIEKSWFWGANGISSNSSITTDFIYEFIDKEWDWGCGGLSCNPAVDEDFIRDNIDKPWDFGQMGISLNKNISSGFIEEFKDKNWYYGNHGLSSNLNICNICT